MPFWTVTGLAAALLVLIASTTWYYQHERDAIWRQAVDQLTTIGRLKADEIAAWRRERLADAAVLAQGPLFAESVDRFLADSRDEHAQPLLARFQNYRAHYNYSDVLLVDREGRCLLNLAGTTAVNGKYRALIAEVFAKRQPLMTDLHVGPHRLAPHISAIAPVFAGAAPDAPPLGAVILISDATQYLYPLIQAWPVPTKTAETTLSCRDGSDVLFLTHLLHQPDAALNLRIPLTQTNVPAVMAARGYTGVVTGPDYRGTKVLSYVTAITNTPWFMVAKQDYAEVFAGWRFRGRLILVVFAALAFGIIAIGAAAWQRNNKAHYRELYASEARRRAEAEELGIILRSIGDAVIATDVEGKVKMLNAVAEALTGWPEAEARGKPLTEVFNIINEESRRKVENPVAHVLREGAIVGLANHTLLIARDGTERPIADSAAPIFDAQGGLTGVVMVFRDKTTEQNYRTLFKKMLDGFAVHEIVRDAAGRPVDYRFLDINPAAENIFGLQSRDVIGKTVMEIFPQTEQFWIEAFGRVVQTGEPANFENYAQSMNKFFNVTAFRTNSTQFAVIFQDITARRQAEQALRESEKKHRSLTDDVLDNTDVGIFILDAEFNVVLINHAMERFFGLKREQVVGQGKRRLIQEQIAGIFEDPEFFKARVLATYDDNTYVEKFECRVLPAGPRLGRWLQHWSQPIRTGLYAGGRIEYYYDISERKQAETEQRRLASAIEQSGDIVVITDTAGNIQYVNHTFEKVTGYSRGDVLGKNPRILKSGKQNEAFYIDLWTHLTQGKVFHGRMINKCKDGSLYTEDATISPVFDASGKIVNYVGVKRDVTERLAMEAGLQQAQKMELVGRLAGGVAHDFNNMLGVIMGNAELAMKKLSPADPAYDEIQEVIKATRRSADITQQLLAFARKQIIAPKMLELNETIESMLKMLRRLIGENIELAWLPAQSPCVVEIDPSQLNQALANLCINSRDAIADVGKIAIETERLVLDKEYCDAHPGSTPGKYVLLKVSDNGCGMDDNTMSHLFEPFFTTKAVGRGTGLGLATVHGIVKQNNGFIQVESQPGQGAAFMIYLPCHAGDAVESLAPAPESLPQGQGETILLVEDETAILKVVKIMLKKIGYTVMAAATPEEALQLARTHAGRIHLLMVDVVMPGMNGRDLAGQIAEQVSNLKCLFMSGYTANVIAHHGVLDKGVHFIQKPFSIQELAASVNRVLYG